MIKKAVYDQRVIYRFFLKVPFLLILFKEVVDLTFNFYYISLIL